MPPVGFEPTISPGERPQTARPLGPAVYCLTANFSNEQIKEDEMGGVCCMQEKKQKAYRVLMGKLEGK